MYRACGLICVKIINIIMLYNYIFVCKLKYLAWYVWPFKINRRRLEKCLANSAKVNIYMVLLLCSDDLGQGWKKIYNRRVGLVVTSVFFGPERHQCGISHWAENSSPHYCDTWCPLQLLTNFLILILKMLIKIQNNIISNFPQDRGP
jgi:hypothetical protein